MRTLLTTIAAMLAGALSIWAATSAMFDYLARSGNEVPYSLRELLLEKVPAPRIVVDSGSNSVFSIVPQLIENEFRLPVIDVADNGAVPWRRR
jgi:hypothetical protein